MWVAMGFQPDARQLWMRPQKSSVKASISWAGKSAPTFWKTASLAASVPKNSWATSSRWCRCLSQNSSKRAVSKRSSAMRA